MTKQEARGDFREHKHEKIFLNDVYQVNVRENSPTGFDWAVTHLSIKRIDKEPIHDWRDLHQIKNEIIGPEGEAVEIYPAESRRVDSANQYHLWVFPEGQLVPFGFFERLVKSNPGGNAKQRPLS